MGNNNSRLRWPTCTGYWMVRRRLGRLQRRNLVRLRRRRRTVPTQRAPIESNQQRRLVVHQESFATLPDAFLEATLSHLNANELARCSKVNHHWRQVANRHSLWKSVIIKEHLLLEDEEACNCSSSSGSGSGSSSGDQANPNISLEPGCQLKFHYGRYTINKSVFASGLSSCIPLEHECGLIQASFSNEQKLIISGKTLKIWDITGEPVLQYNSSKHSNTVDIQLLGDTLLLLKETRRHRPTDDSVLTERYIDFYRCISLNEENPPETPKIFLHNTKRMNVSKTSEFRWFAGDNWFATVKTRHPKNEDKQTALDTYCFRGRRKVRFLFPGNKTIVAGRADVMYLYVLLAEDPEAHDPAVPSVYAYDMLEEELQWASSLIIFRNLMNDNHWIDIWYKRYIVVSSSQGMCWIDRSNGDILFKFYSSQDTLVPYFQRDLTTHVCGDALMTLNYIKSNHSEFASFADIGYVISPYGTILIGLNDKIDLFTTTDGKSLWASIDIKNHMDGIHHLRSCTRHISKTLMVVVCNNQKNAMIFKFLHFQNPLVPF